MKKENLNALDIILISLPASLAVMIEPIAGIVDTALMGHTGTDALAAIAIGVNVVMSISWMFNSIVYQVTADVARNDVRGDRNEIKILKNSSFFGNYCCIRSLCSCHSWC